MQLAALLIAGAIAQQKLETRLAEVEPVTQASRSASIRPVKEFSMSGIVFRDGFQLVPVGTDINSAWARLVYNIPAETHAFKCSLGISDSNSESAPLATFRILIDGELVKELTVDDSVKPTSIDIPLKSAKSLMIQITGAGAVGNPLFSHVAAVTAPPKGTAVTPGDFPRVNLKQPESNATFKN
ncbi:MAG TPA: NPCBM/NEW2 domain-containing protein, partial [Fimbriimonas sp.]|nr:NPCBM/NEW2 domain-containing protein [Fimbriimonas sp.]